MREMKEVELPRTEVLRERLTKSVGLYDELSAELAEAAPARCRARAMHGMKAKP